MILIFKEMDIEELKNIRDYYKISREEMAQRLSIKINTLSDWEYKKKRIPDGKVKLVKYAFSTYFEKGFHNNNVVSEPGVEYVTPINQLEEKERNIRILERTINDKETILELQREKIEWLENELNAFKSSKPLSKKNA